jgi:integrating conjugative element protein (TIGR03765 family)
MGRCWRHGWKGIAIAGVLLPVIAQAELIVIYDSGHTQSLAPFLEAFAADETFEPQRSVIAPPPVSAADPKAWLPIRSPGLTPGEVEARSHERPFARSFFLIGSDAQSRQWLQEHRDRLKALGAVGMLVQADTLEDLRAIADLAQGLPILPASASDIAKALGITHYPVVITTHGIEP